MALGPGQTLSHYRLVEKIGEGGMGVVWRAWDTRLERDVALKVLAARLGADPDGLERLVREARAVATLNHPNIVTIYSVEDDGGVRFITMELVHGKTLAQIIPRGGLSLRSVFELAIPLADALSAAHEHGVIHRDLKPANVILTEDGRPKILDFGLATVRPRAASDLSNAPTEPATQPAHAAGTLPYMSPEQLHDLKVDHRSDIFSLGVILYEMATGQRPFKGDSSAELISSILRDLPLEASEVRRGLPRHLCRIIRHCLEKDAERRCQTAKELRNELADLKDELASQEVVGRVPARSRRFRYLPAVAVTGVLVVLAVVMARWLVVPASHAPPVIAVLTFTNLTGDPARDYLSEGISASLVTQLGEVSGIRVALPSARRNKGGGARSLARIDKELGVSFLAGGELLGDRESLRVNVYLTDASSGLVLWSEVFQGRSDSLFALQREIAHGIMEFLSITLSPHEFQRFSRDPTSSLRAYDHYLQGQRALQDLQDPQMVDLAVEMFRQAIRIDPEFALGHAGLSTALWTLYQKNKTTASLDEAEREARRSIEIDPDLPAAQLALARVYRSTGRYSDSLVELRRILANHPKPDEAERELARTYEDLGDLQEAEKCMRAATALGEDDWFNWNALGALLQRLGRYDEAREAFLRAAGLAPESVSRPLENLAALSILQGRFGEAIGYYDRLPRPIRDPTLASNIGTAYFFSDRTDKWERAREFYEIAVRLNPRREQYRSNLADLLLRIGRTDEARHQYREALRLVEEQLVDNPASRPLQVKRALFTAKAGDCPRALSLVEQLAPDVMGMAQEVHRLAYVYALCGAVDQALLALRRAVDLGFSRKIIRQEDEFSALRQNPEFTALVSEDPAAGP